ncbi:MAG: thioredoxin family protein [Bacteroidota bacterium]
MKRLFYITFFIFIFQGNAQPKYKEIESSNGSVFLLGEITTANLKSMPYRAWFHTNFDAYSVDTKLVKLFETKLRKHEILLFLGTWCGDSKREVPRILKILEAADFPKEQLRIVALDRRKDRYKKGLYGEEKGWNIKRVPTLILLKNGTEVNRIVERPVDTLEEDLLAILSDSSYTPNYAN